MQARIQEWLELAFTAAAEHFAKPKTSIKIIIKHGGEHADYACSSALMLAKVWQLPPLTIANFIADFQLPEFLAKVAVAGPGFINLYLSESFVANELSKISTAGEVLPKLTPQTVVIDYSSPNLAKALHVGHLRTSLLGDALARINTAIGHSVIRQNHVGDWGTQFGMILAYIAEQKINLSMLNNIEELEQIYLHAKQQFDASPAFANNAKAMVVKLQQHDIEAMELWQKFRQVSIAHCQGLYQRLGLLLTATDIVGESFYQDQISSLLNSIKTLLTKSDGALCYFSKQEFGKEGQALPMILQKQDGAFLYGTTDLAAARYRLQQLHADKILYVVDQRQSLHFSLLFELVELCNWGQAKLEHIGFGTVNDASGKPFKTRDGDTVKLESLLSEAHERAQGLLLSRGSEIAENEELAEKIAIAALKYNDLSKPRTSDYSFSYDNMLRFDGNTAPYILYAYVRLNKIQALEAELKITTEPGPNKIIFAEVIEFTLAKKLLDLPDVVLAAATDSMPHYICNYLYELASIAMQFYERCPILTAEVTLKRSRQQLAELTCQFLALGLSLLGIDTIDKM